LKIAITRPSTCGVCHHTVKILERNGQVIVLDEVRSPAEADQVIHHCPTEAIVRWVLDRQDRQR
jgi:hypothetical protein